MQNNNVLAIFDLCDTIVEGQTINLYYNYLLQNKATIIQKVKGKVLKLLAKNRLYADLEKKNTLFSVFKGMNRGWFENAGKDFVKDVIANSFHAVIIERIKFHQRMGHRVVIISGGLDIYVGFIANYLGINDWIASTTNFENKAFIRIEKECLGDVKVDMLAEKIPLKEYDLTISYAYSDSVSDIPLLSLVGYPSIIVGTTDNVSWNKNGWDIIKTGE